MEVGVRGTHTGGATQEPVVTGRGEGGEAGGARSKRPAGRPEEEEGGPAAQGWGCVLTRQVFQHQRQLFTSEQVRIPGWGLHLGPGRVLSLSPG